MFDKSVDIINWIKTKLYLHKIFTDNPQKYRAQTYPKWSIYTCHLGENIGDEKNGFGRPVLIVSNDSINQNSGNVVVVALSKNIKMVSKNGKRQLKYSSHYVLKKTQYTKLKYDSALMCEDIKIVNKARLGAYICNITDTTDRNNIKKRLKYVFNL